MVPSLEADRCQVWWARPADSRPDLDRLLEPGERERRDRLVRAEDRDRLTVGAALARLVLAGHLDRPAERLRFDRTCGTCGGDHGKPRLVADAGGLELSISHSGARVAVAVVRGGPVGVDVERVPPDLDADALARLVLSEHERAGFERLPHADRRRALLTYWTRKEALLKATGEGLRAAMPGITVSGPDEPPLLRDWPERPAARPVALRALRPGSGYVASLAVLGLTTVRVRELDGGELLAGGSG